LQQGDLLALKLQNGIQRRDHFAASHTRVALQQRRVRRHDEFGLRNSTK
jgi:hypothetical protein